MEIDFRKCAAEFIGSFILVFAVAMAAAAIGNMFIVAVVNGLAVLAAIFIVVNVSGAQINPAVTVALILAKKEEPVRGFYYIIMQFLGGIAAAAVLAQLMSTGSTLGTPALSQGVTFLQGVVAEAIGTGILVLVVLMTAVDKRADSKQAPFAISGALAAAVLLAGPVTGGSLNPARAFGPALLSNTMASQAVYWLGPLLGALAALLLYEYVLKE